MNDYPIHASDSPMYPAEWWRVMRDGALWCETSDEQEAMASMRPGDRMQRLWIVTFSEWRDTGRGT